MVNSRLLAVLGMLVVAIVAVQADAALPDAGAWSGAAPGEPGLLLLILLAVVTVFVVATGHGAAPAARRSDPARARARNRET